MKIVATKSNTTPIFRNSGVFVKEKPLHYDAIFLVSCYQLLNDVGKLVN